MLFQELDINKDGLLDEMEFEMLFNRQPDQGQYITAGAVFKDHVAEEDLGKYMHGGYNTYNKRPLDVHEMLQLPQFTGTIRTKMELRRRGKEVG